MTRRSAGRGLPLDPRNLTLRGEHRRWPNYFGLTRAFDLMYCAGCGAAAILPAVFLDDGTSRRRFITYHQDEGWTRLPWLAIDANWLCPSCTEHVITEYTARGDLWLHYAVCQERLRAEARD